MKSDSALPVQAPPPPPIVEQFEKPGALIRCVANVAPESTHWLVPDRIPRRKTTMIVGDPGLGKSQLTLGLAAIVSKGGQFPVDRSLVRQGNVLLLNAEDDVADTIRPRLDAAGADASKIYVLDAIRDVAGDGRISERSFNLARDLDQLEQAAKTIGGVSLIVIDPISAYLGGVDSHKNSDVRALLAPMSDLAHRLDAAVVAVSHLNKADGGGNALYRVSGSLAFVAAARSMFFVVKDPKNPQRRLLLHRKNNLGRDDQPGMAFRVEPVMLDNGISTSRLSWDTEPVAMTAEDALATMAGFNGEGSKSNEIATWLRDLLQDGRMTARAVQLAAEKAGFDWHKVQRKREAAGVQSNRIGFGQGAVYYWSIDTRQRREDCARDDSALAADEIVEGEL